MPVDTLRSNLATCDAHEPFRIPVMGGYDQAVPNV